MSTQDKLEEALRNARSFVSLFHDDPAQACVAEIDAALQAHAAETDKEARLAKVREKAREYLTGAGVAPYRSAHAAEAAHEGSLLTGTTPDGKHYGLRGSKESVDTVSDMLIIAEATQAQPQAAEPVAWGKFVNDGGPMQGELYEFAKTKFEVDVLIKDHPVNDNGKFIAKPLYIRPTITTLNKTLDNPPQQFQRVLYWFEPFQKWYLGHYVDGSFCSYSGFCDHHDAPYWSPLPPSPKQ